MSIIDNSSNINKLTNNSLSTVSSSNTQGTASASPLPLVDTQKQELIKKLGITLEQYEALKAQVPDFDILGLDKQAELINSLGTQKVNGVQNTAEQEEVSQPKTEYQLYNEKSPDEKIDSCFEALAKDIYINGVKDKNGNFIKIKNNDSEFVVTSHKEEEWDKLSDAEKKAEVQKLSSFIENNKELKNMKDNLATMLGEKDNIKEAFADTVMRGMNVAKENGVSYLDYLKKDEYERLDLESQYLFDQDNLNSTDRAYMKYTATLKEQVGKIVSAKIGEDVTNNLDISDVAKYIKYYNLSKDELLYNAAMEKNPTDRTEADNKLIENFQLPNYRDLINIAKAKNLKSLQEEFNSYETKLKNGEKLTSEEEGHYSSLKEYVSSKEAKNLEKIEIPVAKTPEEKRVAEHWKNFDSKTKNLSSDLKGTLVLNKIMNDLKNIPEREKRKDYIINSLKFSDLDQNVVSFVMNGLPQEQKDDLAANKDLFVRKNVSITIDSFNLDQKKTFISGACNLLDSEDQNAIDQANKDLQSINGIFARKSNKSEENDEAIMLAGKAATLSKNAETYNTAFDAGLNMTNAESQMEHVNRLMDSKNAPEDFYVDSVSKIPALFGENQIPTLDKATKKSKKATAAAIKGNILKDLVYENQKGGLSILHKRTEEQYDKEEAIKYSNMLADQIKDCHKDNQLAMHNEMMNSKYSEVQEHVAGNIKDYDPTVQTKALETVLASGNEKAIDAAAESIKYSPDCVKSEMAEVVAAYASNNAIKADSAILEQFADAIAAQNKTIQEKIASGQVLSESELSTLSIAERRDYLTSFFKKLPVDKKIKLLASMPDSQKKTVYTLIARTDSTLFNAIIRDKDRADQLLSMGLPEDVNNKIKNVVSFLAVSDIGYQNIAAKYEIEYDNDSNKTKNTAYTTMPQDFDTKEIYKKDKLGNILA